MSSNLTLSAKKLEIKALSYTVVENLLSLLDYGFGLGQTAAIMQQQRYGQAVGRKYFIWYYYAI